MGSQLQTSSSRRSRRSLQRRTPISEINVTPFVDVMLVLLIIFMVTAPLLTSGIEVNLPETNEGSITEPVEPLTVSINSEGKVFIQETEIGLENLVPKLMAITERKTDTRVYVRGDRAIDYGRIMEVMGAINASGFRNVALVTEKIKAK